MQSASDFLESMYPNDLWVVSAISPDGHTQVPTRTYDSSNKDECQTFVNLHNGSNNLYFHVNPPLKAYTKKLERTDIKEVAYLHVDIDPPKGQPSSEEFIESAISKLNEKRPKSIPKPTYTVFSGGGLQAFWKLSTPISIGGDLAKAEEAKRYNQQLEKMFGADNCHNIDRLMRLPFTENIPNAKKKKAGRVRAQATVLDIDKSAVYDISTFHKVSGVVQSPAMSGDVGEIPTGVKRITDLDQLDKYDLSRRMKVVIVQGEDVEYPLAGDNSRSSWVFFFICQAIKLKIPEDVIFSLLTDENYGISDSILDRGDKSQYEAMRQIKRAQQKSIAPQLLELNDRHFVVLNRGGDCCTCEELYNESLGRDALTFQSFGAFKNRYLNRKIQIGTNQDGTPKMTSLGSWWLTHPQRRQFTSIVFAPEKDIKDSYNLWQGFAVDSCSGDCSLYLTHIKDNICNGNEQYYEYLINWMATCIQFPARTGQVAVVLRGEKGTGKGVFANTLGALFGRHFLPVSNPKHLVGQFNSHLRDIILLFGDEAFFAGDKQHESVLKTLITEPTFPIESKGIDVIQCPNYTHLILAANADHVVPAGGAERRYLVLDVADGSRQNSVYFEAISHQMQHGGLEALLYFLKRVDLTGFNVRTVPQTSGLAAQKEMTLNVTEGWWYEKLRAGKILDTSTSWEKQVTKEKIENDLFVTHGKGGGRFNRETSSSLRTFLKKFCPGLSTKQMYVTEPIYDDDGVQQGTKTERPSGYVLPSLKVCREAWLKKNPGLDDWDTEQESLI